MFILQDVILNPPNPYLRSNYCTSGYMWWVENSSQWLPCKVCVWWLPQTSASPHILQYSCTLKFNCTEIGTNLYTMDNFFLCSCHKYIWRTLLIANKNVGIRNERRSAIWLRYHSIKNKFPTQRCFTSMNTGSPSSQVTSGELLARWGSSQLSQALYAKAPQIH